MTLSEAWELLTYDTWATERTLKAVGHVTHEQLHKETSGEGSSIHSRLRHLLRTKHEWLLGMVNKDWTHMQVPATSSVDDLLNYHQLVEAIVAECMQNVEDTRLAETYDHPMTYGEIITHAVNHGTFHRGQIAVLLQQFGVDFEDTDFFYWRLDCIGLPPPP